MLVTAKYLSGSLPELWDSILAYLFRELSEVVEDSKRRKRKTSKQSEAFVPPSGVSMAADEEFTSVEADFPKEYKAQCTNVEFEEKHGKFKTPNITLYLRSYDPVYNKDQLVFLRLDHANQSFDPKSEYPVNAQTYTGIFFKFMRDRAGWPVNGFQKRKVIDVANDLKGMYMHMKKLPGKQVAPKAQSDKWLCLAISKEKIP